jgi:hypothetical protein
MKNWIVDTAALVVRRLYVSAETEEEAEEIAKDLFSTIENSYKGLGEGGQVTNIDFSHFDNVIEEEQSSNQSSQKWLVCKIVKGMFTNELTVTIKNSSGLAVSVFVPKEAVCQYSSLVKVYHFQLNGQDFVVLPDEYKTQVSVNAEDLRDKTLEVPPFMKALAKLIELDKAGVEVADVDEETLFSGSLRRHDMDSDNKTAHEILDLLNREDQRDDEELEKATNSIIEDMLLTTIGINLPVTINKPLVLGNIRFFVASVVTPRHRIYSSDFCLKAAIKKNRKKYFLFGPQMEYEKVVKVRDRFEFKRLLLIYGLLEFPQENKN